MKQGFETADGKRVDVETAFKNPEHPFRVAIVCAMWLTGFDVECLSTLYIDKPMKAHTLMQAIARANRRYPGKDFGLFILDQFYTKLPSPSFTEEDKQEAAAVVYRHVWQQAVSGAFRMAT